MSHDEREAVAAHLAGYSPVALPMGGDHLRFVAGLFASGTTLTVSEVTKAAMRHDPTISQKQVYNALGYLTRRRAIRRLKYGRYALPLSPGNAPFSHAGYLVPAMGEQVMVTCAVVFGPVLVGALALAFGFAIVHFNRRGY